MTRYTEKQFRAELANINKNLAFDLSLTFVKWCPRNGYQAADQVKILSSGKACEIQNIEIGSPRECIATVYREACHFERDNKNLTRQQAKQLAIIAGIDFDRDFHELSGDQVELLQALAKASKYRAPATRNGSKARYFFAHLARRVSVPKCDYLA